LPLSSTWSGAAKLAEPLVTCAFDPKARTFRRRQALALLSELFRNKNLTKVTGQLLKEDMSYLHGKIISELNKGGACGGGTPKYQAELLVLLAVLHKQQEEICSPHMEAVKQALNTFKDSIHKNRNFQEVKAAFNKAAAVINVERITGSKKTAGIKR